MKIFGSVFFSFWSLVAAMALLAFPSCKPTNVVKNEATVGNSILLENFTADWCSSCYYEMKNINKQTAGLGNKVILVSHHWKDDFAISHSKELGSFYKVSGIPLSMIDRTKGLVSDGVIFYPGKLTRAVLDKKLAEPKSVTILLTTSYSEGSKDIKVKVEGELLRNLPKANLNVYLIQDSIVYQQAKGGDKYVHRNALRAVLSKGTWGDALGVAQGKYSKEYTYKLPAKIGKFATNPAQMYIVAFVADAVNTSGDNTKNVVHNAAIKGIK